MSEERRRGDDDGEEGGPGAAYMQFVVMEELLDKLKLLNYESSFSRQIGMKPFSRHYFAIATNPGEQFHAFTSLAAWLLRTAGKHMDQPQEYDDPNATIANILDELRQFGHTVDFPPSKLKQGCGEKCIEVLDKLANEALKSTMFMWNRPSYPEEEADEEDIIDDESELELNKPLEEVEQADDEDEYEDEARILDLDGLKKNKQSQDGESSKPEEILLSTTDAAEWKLEVERILPQLKVTIRTDNKDWRVHVEQMHQHAGGIETSLTETKTHLDKLHDEITRTLEKIGSREKYINTQLEQSLQEFRHMQDRLAETKERYRQGSGGVTERTRILAEVTEELEKVKQEMEERGSSMTDGAPLVKIKQAIVKIKSEITQMDIRTGVLEHILLQAKMRERTENQRQLPGDDPYEIKAY
ncbi:intraflagellar transport protein 57 homolog [Tubulanus polymorphus]|uniref:intraflagellar transport protein 57 homolog n=1 Tax=Tubulanus polymorphus TaxID=672921 RepID=UPI003DA33DA4